MTKSIDLIPTWYWPDGVPRYLSPPQGTVYATAIERWARRTPENVAVSGSREVTYRELAYLVRAASARLRRSLSISDANGEPPRMAIDASHDPDCVAVMLAALHAGADTLLLDPATPENERAAALKAFGCRLLVSDRRPAPAGDWETVGVKSCLEPAEADADLDVGESRRGRWGLGWSRSFALQPNATLLGWALAFRAFAVLDKTARFMVFRPLSTWEGIIGLLAPLAAGATCLLPTGSVVDPIGTRHHVAMSGAWLDWSQVEVALESGLDAGRPELPWEWVFVSVSSPVLVRKRRRLQKLLHAQVLTAFGTPATGPIAASPREWSIDEAVGTPITGIDVLPINERGQIAEPPWHLLAGASIGVKSSFQVPEMALEGPDSARIMTDGSVNTMAHGRMDANGLLYLL